MKRKMPPRKPPLSLPEVKPAIGRKPPPKKVVAQEDISPRCVPKKFNSKIHCIACSGTGISSSKSPCYPCGGKGLKKQ